ncbi:hypothetical protein FKM82_023311 [Ascaphus truei]
MLVLYKETMIIIINTSGMQGTNCKLNRRPPPAKGLILLEKPPPLFAFHTIFLYQYLTLEIFLTCLASDVEARLYIPKTAKWEVLCKRERRGNTIVNTRGHSMRVLEGIGGAGVSIGFSIFKP